MDYRTDENISEQEREWRDHCPWVAIDWGKPNELPEETHGVIDGMTGQYQVHTDDECEDWIADAHSMEEAERIAAEHNTALAKEAGISHMTPEQQKAWGNGK